MTINANRRRPALGSDPFETLVPETPPPSSRQKRKAKVRKIRATFHLRIDLFDRARDAVYWTPGLTLSSLCEAGLRSEIVNLERKRGKAFPKRAGDLKAGRPDRCVPGHRSPETNDFPLQGNRAPRWDDFYALDKGPWHPDPFLRWERAGADRSFYKRRASPIEDDPRTGRPIFATPTALLRLVFDGNVSVDFSEIWTPLPAILCQRAFISPPLPSRRSRLRQPTDNQNPDRRFKYGRSRTARPKGLTAAYPQKLASVAKPENHGHGALPPPKGQGTGHYLCSSLHFCATCPIPRSTGYALCLPRLRFG